MPDKRQHRGMAPGDAALFAADQWPKLRAAAADLAWLQSRGYAEDAALKLVGDRHKATARQQLAVRRCACSDSARDDRRRRQLGAGQIAGQRLLIDGFNLLVTLEAALSGGVLLCGRDGCIRDLASVHGSYRRVTETQPALELAGAGLAALQPAACVWYLDRPVSNSGRLAASLRALAENRAWPWQVEVVFNPDRELVAAGGIVISADAGILDRCGPWFNFAAHLLPTLCPQPPLLDLG